MSASSGSIRSPTKNAESPGLRSATCARSKLKIPSCSPSRTGQPEWRCTRNRLARAKKKSGTSPGYVPQAALRKATAARSISSTATYVRSHEDCLRVYRVSAFGANSLDERFPGTALMACWVVRYNLDFAARSAAYNGCNGGEYEWSVKP